MAKLAGTGQSATRSTGVAGRWDGMRQAIILVLLAALLGVVCWAATAGFRSHQLEHVRTHVTATAVARATTLSESINHKFALLRALAAYATRTARPHEAQPGFDTVVPILAGSMSGIRNMGVMPDGITKYIYPLKGNETVLGMSIYGDDRPEVRAAVERALSTHQVTLNDPYELRQGGLGLVARTGVWQGTTLWGMVTTVLDMPVVLAEAGLSENDGVDLTALRDQSGNVFFGDQSVFDASPVIQRVTLIDSSWELASVPVLGWEGAVRDDVRSFALAGSFIAVLILLSSYLVLSGNSRLTRLVDLRTGELELDRHQRELLIQTAPDGIVFVDAAGATTFANAAGERILELQTSVLEGRRYDDPAWSICALDGDPFPPDQLPFAQVKASGKSVSNVRHAIVLPDGRRKLLSINAAPVFTADGTFSGMVASLQDITERTQAEEQIARKDELLRMTGEMAQVGGWEFDVASAEGTWTDEVARIHGLDPTAPTNVGLGVSFYVGESRTRIEAAIDQAIEHGTPYDLELEICAANGEHKWVRTKGVPVRKQGRTSQLRGTFQDITERKLAEQALREREERLSLALSIAHMGYWRYEVASGILQGYEEHGTLFGVATDGHGWTLAGVQILVHPDDRAYAEMALQRTVAEGVPFDSTYRTVLPSGETRWLHSLGHLHRDASGRPDYVFGVTQDITDRKQAEAEKEAVQAQLLQSQKMEAIGQLAGGVAHDFNNMLTGILGNIAIMRGGLPASDPLVANLNGVETAARQAADLAKGLLTFSRKAVVAAVSLDMAEVVDTALTILKQSLPATMNIIRDVEQPAWSVMADRSQIAQVILNLAVNARDAMSGKGTLTIRLRSVQVDEEYVRTHTFARTGDFVQLSVADTGPGIPDEIREHLFEPFFTTKPEGHGTGLGLSIVYGAVKQAGGWVTADSPIGAGTVFDIFLPRCLEKPSATAVPVPVTGNVCSRTVLVVEDEPVVCAVAQALLTRSGCTVLTAGDGASGLATFRARPATIDIILLDMTMPGMTTDDIVQAIRAVDAHVPILLTSGYTSSDTVKRMLEDGTVQGFLPKPYDLHELLDRVQQLQQRS